MKEAVDDNYKLLSSKMTYIVDTSVFSEIPDGNTEFPTLILAEHASNII
jgi:choline dehydrogenase-like flavoprotein